MLLYCRSILNNSFNTQPPEGGWAIYHCSYRCWQAFQHTAARRRLAIWMARLPHGMTFQHTAARRRLDNGSAMMNWVVGFQHTAARRRLEPNHLLRHAVHCFNTQPPEGGWFKHYYIYTKQNSFNTQPPEGGWLPIRCFCLARRVSTHSRPKAAGPSIGLSSPISVSFNTQPPEGGWPASRQT